MKCVTCSFDCPDGMAFCGKCGNALVISPASTDPGNTLSLEVKCPRCDATMPAEASFCGLCGEQLTAPPVSNLTPEDTPPLIQPTPPAAYIPSHPKGLLLAEGTLRNMVQVRGCTFSMGRVGRTGNENEQPCHQVQLTDFDIDCYAVSNAEYERFDPSHQRQRPETSNDDDDPVVYVTYQDCLNYCRWRDEQEGVSAGTYSLPTEAQWECAARAGHADRVFPWGNELDTSRCNTFEAQRGETVPVQQGPANDWGLFHMGSNIREWCRDWYDEHYYRVRAAAGPDPRGPTVLKVVNFRVVRGACFRDKGVEFSRCAARNYGHPSSSSDDTGFRCVRPARRDT